MPAVFLKILQSTHSPPDYIPPPLLAPDQVICGPHYPDSRNGKRVISIKTASGSYDIAPVVASLPLEQRPDLFVARVDSSGVNLPANVAGLKCRKVLLLGDTHHLAKPLQRLIGYALQEHYDAIIIDYDRHHAHFFIEAGIGPVYWLPGINIRRLPVQPKAKPDIPFSFVGQAGKFHPRRRALCQSLIAAGLPLRVMSATSAQTRALHARSRVNLNCSLNGDFNLRFMEVLASGGFLLSDRLNPASGLDLLFIEGVHYVAYDDDRDCVEKAWALLADPDLTRKIASAGKSHYEAHYSTDRILGDFFALIDAGTVRPEFDLALERRCQGATATDRAAVLGRAALYEIVQAIHIGRERVRMLVSPGVDPAFVTDCADLPRLDLAAEDIEGSQFQPRLLAAGFAGRITSAGQGGAHNPAQWDLLAATVSEWRAGWAQGILAANLHAMLLLTDVQASDSVAAEIAEAGLTQVATDTPLYARNAASPNPGGGA